MEVTAAVTLLVLTQWVAAVAGTKWRAFVEQSGRKQARREAAQIAVGHVLADLPRLRAWLQTPEVVRWWGDPAEQLELIREDLPGAELPKWRCGVPARQHSSPSRRTHPVRQ
jgi:hypothetical protein